MHAWASGDAALGYNAHGFLLGLEDLAIVPTIEQSLPSAPEAAAKALLLVSEGESNLRRKLLLRVNALLDDTRELPAAPGQPARPVAFVMRRTAPCAASFSFPRPSSSNL